MSQPEMLSNLNVNSHLVFGMRLDKSALYVAVSAAAPPFIRIGDVARGGKAITPEEQDELFLVRCCFFFYSRLRLICLLLNA